MAKACRTDQEGMAVVSLQREGKDQGSEQKRDHGRRPLSAQATPVFGEVEIQEGRNNWRFLGTGQEQEEVVGRDQSH